MKLVKIYSYAGEFAEDKDCAAKIRREIVFPALENREKLTLDFTKVTGATQSFLHALIADPIRKLGAQVLTLVTFKGCNQSIQGIVEIVVDYVQLDVEADVSETR